MVTQIFLAPDGTYKTSLAGRRIKYDPHDSKRYIIVSPELHREKRIINSKKSAENIGKVVRSEAHAAGEAPPDLPGIRLERDIVHAAIKSRYDAKGESWDAPDKNTIRMLVKLRRHNPVYEKEFVELLNGLGAHYFKYNPVSHSFEMYNHRQVYKGSYQLPILLRSKKTKGIVQHYERTRYKEGPTKIYYHSGAEGGKLVAKMTDYAVRPPGPGRGDF